MTAATALGRSESAPDEVLDKFEYLTVPEVARVLRVSPATVYRLVNADPSMPVLRLPGMLRFPRVRLERWLRDREQGQGKPRGIRHQVLSPAKLALAKEGGAGYPAMR